MWHHTWWKNWVNCTFLSGNSAGLRTVLSSRLSHRELHISLRESHGFLSLPADTRLHRLETYPFLAIHSADEHHMIYSFTNTTSYFTFYTFFSSFWKTLWPIWLANSKWQPCFIHHSHVHKKTHRTDKKTDKPDGKPVLCQKTFSSIFRAVFLNS